MPLLLIIFFLVDLLSVAYPFIAYKLWREWDTYRNTVEDEYAQRCLYGAIALLAVILLGKFLMKMLMSKTRKGEDEPHMFDAEKGDTLKRPDGSTINIEYYGRADGQAIIFVHGWNANIKSWYYQRKYFEKDYRLIMMDLPGLGKSTRPDNKDFSLPKMASDLNAVIEHTGARAPILWGHSIGGMTILTLLAKLRGSLKEPVSGIILQHTTYTNPVRTTLFSKMLIAMEKPVLVPLCYFMIALSPVLWIIRWMSYLNGNSHLMTRILTFAGTQTGRQLDFITLLATLAPPAVTARGVLGMFKYDVTKELPDINVPALIIAADKDLLTRPAASHYMKDHLPDARLVTLTPSNHQGLVERHRETNEAAEQFIRSIVVQPSRQLS
jgi:pimeloyl-ACP methyl ester carboxylesterase